MRTLLLDDDQKNFVLFRSILTQVIQAMPPNSPQPESTCSDFNEALNLVSNFEFDLVFIDLSWDTLNQESELLLGRALIAACRARSSQTVIVALTKVGTVDDLRQAREDGADIALTLQDALVNIFPVRDQIIERLRLSRGSPSPSKSRARDSIFVVHGRDSSLRNEVELFLRQIGLAPVVLLARANRGRTLAEKFEEEASSCSFAVVLATADDSATDALSGDPEQRARQNVIFELGWFQGRLGRRSTVLIKDPSVVLPSDIAGTVYLSTQAWKFELMKELRDSGFEVDPSEVT